MNITNEEYQRIQTEFDMKDIDLLAEDENPSFYILSLQDKEEISSYFRSKYDWDYSAREQLLNATKYYMQEKFPKAAINIAFYNDRKPDETQFDVESLLEAGNLWVDFCKENQLLPSCIEGYYFPEDIPLDEIIPYERLFDILHDYISQDLDASTSDYVRDDVLRNICGCTDDEIRALGFSYIVEVQDD